MYLSGSMVHDPMTGSRPNWPHFDSRVGSTLPNPRTKTKTILYKQNIWSNIVKVSKEAYTLLMNKRTKLVIEYLYIGHRNLIYINRITKSIYENINLYHDG